MFSRTRAATIARASLIIVAVGGAALAISLRSLPNLASLLSSPSPVGFSFVVLLFGIFFTLAIAFRANRQSPLSTRATANLVVISTLVALLALLAFKLHSPAEWLHFYFDVALVPLVLFAGCLLVIRPQRVFQVALAALYTFLAWPPLLIKLVAWLNPPLIAATKWFALLFARITVLPIVGSATSNVLTLTPKNFSVTIGEVCAGTATVLAITVLLIPILSLLRGPLRKKILLFVLAILLSILGNALRAFSIFVVAYISTPERALGFYHSVAGAIAFTLLAIVLLLLAWRLRLRLPRAGDFRLPELRPSAWAAVAVFVGGLSLSGLGLLPLGFDKPSLQPAVAEQGVAPQFGGDPAALNKHTSAKYKLTFREPFSYVPSLKGFKIKNFSLSFADNLFGPTADYQRFEYQPTDGSPSYFADVAVTPSGSDLLALNTEVCYEFHNYQILHQEELPLNHNLNGFFFSYRDTRGKPWESVDFITPTSDDLGHVYYRRIKIVRIVPDQTTNDFVNSRQQLVNFTYGLIDSLFSE